MELVNQCNVAYNEYSLFITPINNQSAYQSWSPFSTPSISPYGSPTQTSFSYSTPLSNSTINSNPLTYFQSSHLPTPISRPSKRHHSSGNTTTQSSTNSQKSTFPKRSEQVDMSNYIRNSQNSFGRSKLCTFCKSNGECEQIYKSHSLKNSANIITCPVLMQYTCVECGASGQNTHTIKYCPVMQKKLRNKMLNKKTTMSDH